MSIAPIFKCLRLAACGLALALCACGSGGGTGTTSAQNPVPSLSSLSPASAVSGSAAFTLTVSGSDFVAASTVNWNGTALATTYVGAAQLTALISASDLASAATVSVTVDNPVPGGGTSNAATFTINATGAYIKQSAQYIAYPGTDSGAWNITLNGVQAGSTIYVVGTWPNASNLYSNMAVTDGTNTYTLLDRYDDTTTFNLGIQGTQSMGHWYAANVSAGSYTINMSPTPQTYEDWVGLVAFEVAGVSSNPQHTLHFQAGIAPGTNTVNATVTTNDSSGILIAVTFDDIDATAPTEPLAGSGFTSVARPLWDFTQTGMPAAAAEYALITASGANTATFSPQEGGSQFPDYMTCAAIFE